MRTRGWDEWLVIGSKAQRKKEAKKKKKKKTQKRKKGKKESWAWIQMWEGESVRCVNDVIGL